MWELLREARTVDELAAQAGLPRRTLERRFRTAVGCRIRDEMQRRRVQEFCRLLRHSDVPVQDLALQVGYRSLVATRTLHGVGCDCVLWMAADRRRHPANAFSPTHDTACPLAEDTFSLTLKAWYMPALGGSQGPRRLTDMLCRLKVCHIRSPWGRGFRRECALFVARLQRAWTCGTASGPSDPHWADMWSTFSAHQRNATAPFNRSL